MAQLVMAAGSAPGAGKSTLIERLALALRADGERVDVVWEDDVWGARRIDDQPVDFASARPEFVELLHERRDPPATGVAATFDLMAGHSTADRWLQDWTWQDLAAAVSPQPLSEVPHDLRARLVNHRAMVVYLEVDPIVGVSRALNERGPIWLRRHALMLGLSDTSDVAAVARWHSERAAARRHWVFSGGVTGVVLDASRAIDSVIETAHRTLRSQI